MALHSTFCPYCRNNFYLSDQAEGEVHCGHCSRLIHVQNHGSVRIIDNKYTGEPNQNVTSTRANRNTLTKRRKETDQVQPPTICVPDTPSQTLSKTAAALKQYVTPVFTGVMMFSFATVVLQVAGGYIPPARQPEPSPVVPIPTKVQRPIQIVPSTPLTKTSSLSKLDLMHRAAGSVATILGKTYSGSGFVIGPSLIATNYHVIFREQINDIRVEFPDNEHHKGKTYPTSLISFDASNDLAILKFQADGIKPLKLNENYIHKVGQPVTAIGSPGDKISDQSVLPNFFTDGRLGPEVLVSGRPHWALSMPVYGGNSGGPVLDRNTLEVVAVISLGEEAKTYAVPHRFLLEQREIACQADIPQIELVNIEHQIMYCLIQMKHYRNKQIEAYIKLFSKYREVLNQDNKVSFAGILNFEKLRKKLNESLLTHTAFFTTSIKARVKELEKMDRCDLEASIAAKKIHRRLEDNNNHLKTTVTPSTIKSFLNSFVENDNQVATLIDQLESYTEPFGGRFSKYNK